MTPERNNFKELFREEELRFQAKQQREEDEIASGIWRALGFFKLIGNVVDVFIPKIFELIIAALGGDVRKMDDTQTFSVPPSQGPGIDPRNIEPSEPEEDDQPRGPEST